jgi:hypothetical protein
MTVALVKTCKTFKLSNGLDWKNIKTRVEGVKFVDERRAVMIFHGSGSKETTLLGYDKLGIVQTCSLYEPIGAQGNDDDDAAILLELVAASRMIKTYITGLSYDFSVFQVDTNVAIDVFSCHSSLRRLGACVVMDRELHDALLITDDRVVWSISDTVPQKILASVSGVGPSEARRLVNKSRRTVGLF